MSQTGLRIALQNQNPPHLKWALSRAVSDQIYYPSYDLFRWFQWPLNACRAIVVASNLMDLPRRLCQQKSSLCPPLCRPWRSDLGGPAGWGGSEGVEGGGGWTGSGWERSDVGWVGSNVSKKKKMGDLKMEYRI